MSESRIGAVVGVPRSMGMAESMALRVCFDVFADHQDSFYLGAAYVDHRCDCERCRKLPRTIERGE